MPNPEGYRKARRLMDQAEKFRRPVLTFIDTPGAYPGLEAEERGQGEAIARTLARMSALTVPTVAVITGEGGSGGALALGVGNVVLMQENAVYSVLSPEGFAAILWKDAGRAEEASGVMQLTAPDLRPAGGHRRHHRRAPRRSPYRPGRCLRRHGPGFDPGPGLPAEAERRGLAAQRYQKFRAMGDPAGKKERA